MKIGGRLIKAPSPVEVTIFRENEQGQPDNFVFICGPVLDYGPFEKICPLPKPPLVMVPGKDSYPNLKDNTYQKAVEQRSERRIQYLILTSLAATPDLVWDTVDINKPDTWENYDKELTLFLTPKEKEKVIGGVFDANIPSENRRKEAIENFTPTQAEQ
jgi:hypothetical protein